MASPLDVMRMVLAPAEAMFSSAAIWPAVSPSLLPAAVSNLAPAFLASASAPSFILTKKGLVSVLVIRPITGWVCAEAAQAAKAMQDSSQRRVEWVMVVSSMSAEEAGGRRGGSPLRRAAD